MAISTTYRIDIDGTIAHPRFFDDDLRTCCDWYVNEEIVTSEEVTAMQYHQQLFLLPHVLMTHVPLPGSVEALQRIVAEGETLQYFTVRQALDPVVCGLVHGSTRIWLRDQYFPCPDQVQFFWDPSHKLIEALKAEEDHIILIDDRPGGLLQAYQKIVEDDPDMAQQIGQRVTVLAFGVTDLHACSSSLLRVLPLASWSLFNHVCSKILLEDSK